MMAARGEKSDADLARYAVRNHIVAAQTMVEIEGYRVEEFAPTFHPAQKPRLTSSQSNCRTLRCRLY